MKTRLNIQGNGDIYQTLPWEPVTSIAQLAARIAEREKIEYVWGSPSFIDYEFVDDAERRLVTAG